MSQVPVLLTSQARALEELAISDYGYTGYNLMATAGQFSFDWFIEHYPETEYIAVVCGAGNNGGDGYVFANAARSEAIDVEVFYTAEPKTLVARRAYEKFRKQRGKLKPVKSVRDFSMYDAVIDAMVGIGLKNSISSELAQVIERINDTARLVVSLDVPSGIDADTGEVLGAAVKAGMTISFLCAKPGLLTDPGNDHTGMMIADSLDLPDSLYSHIDPLAHLIDPYELANHVSLRKRSAHKGSSGHILIIGGSHTMEGAAFMAARAAYRAGAGLVSIALIDASPAISTNDIPEIRVFRLTDVQEFEDLMDSCDVIGIGPGLGQGALARAALELVARSDKNIVVDADGLNLLALTDLKREDWILTPHPGEAGTLLDEEVFTVQDDRLDSATRIVGRYGGICVLKGANTVVASDESRWVCAQGNAGMATAGMGDILTGAICGVWAQGMTADAAARTGVWLHAEAGDGNAENFGMLGMMATDLLPAIRINLNRLAHGFRPQISAR